MELIPKVTLSSQLSPAAGRAGGSSQTLAAHPAQRLGDGKVTPLLPQQSQVLSSSTRGLREVLKTIKTKRAKQGTKPFLLRSRTCIVCMQKYLLPPHVAPLRGSDSSFGKRMLPHHQATTSTEPQGCLWLWPGRRAHVVALPWDGKAQLVTSTHLAQPSRELSSRAFP